jgi:hypothetical protein
MFTSNNSKFLFVSLMYVYINSHVFNFFWVHLKQRIQIQFVNVRKFCHLLINIPMRWWTSMIDPLKTRAVTQPVNIFWPMGRPGPNPFTLLAKPAPTRVWRKTHLGNPLKKNRPISSGSQPFWKCDQTVCSWTKECLVCVIFLMSHVVLM